MFAIKKKPNNTGANEWPNFKMNVFPIIKKKRAINTGAKRISK